MRKVVQCLSGVHTENNRTAPHHPALDCSQRNRRAKTTTTKCPPLRSSDRRNRRKGKALAYQKGSFLSSPLSCLFSEKFSASNSVHDGCYPSSKWRRGEREKSLAWLGDVRNRLGSRREVSRYFTGLVD